MRCAILILLAVGAADARTVGDRVASRSQEARALYEAGRYEEALRVYSDALVERPGSAGLHLNVGDAQFQLGDYEAALKEFERAAAAEDPELSASGHYNKGNAHFQLQDYQAAVEAYQEALQRIPADFDAKANLELALQRIQTPPPSPQGGGEPKEDPEGEEEGPQSSTPQPARPEQQDPSSDDESQEPSGDPQPPNPDDGEADPPPSDATGEGMDEKDAQQLLDALRDHEQDAQDRRYRARGRGNDARDW